MPPPMVRPQRPAQISVIPSRQMQARPQPPQRMMPPPRMPIVPPQQSHHPGKDQLQVFLFNFHYNLGLPTRPPPPYDAHPEFHPSFGMYNTNYPQVCNPVYYIVSSFHGIFSNK